MSSDKFPETRFRCKECAYIAMTMNDALDHRVRTGHAKMKEEECSQTQ